PDSEDDAGGAAAGGDAHLAGVDFGGGEQQGRGRERGDQTPADLLDVGAGFYADEAHVHDLPRLAVHLEKRVGAHQQMTLVGEVGAELEEADDLDRGCAEGGFHARVDLAELATGEPVVEDGSGFAQGLAVGGDDAGGEHRILEID